MRNIYLRSNQIITLRDYPVHNEHILRIYYRIFIKNHGKILPPCPVIHKSSGIPFITKKDAKSQKYNSLLMNFLEENPHAEYFLLDGSHKTTAATLAHKLIPAIIIEQDRDFAKAKQLIKSGEFFGWNSPESSIKEALAVLARHYSGTKQFWTVEEKTRKMAKERKVPDYMIKGFG